MAEKKSKQTKGYWAAGRYAHDQPDDAKNYAGQNWILHLYTLRTSCTRLDAENPIELSIASESLTQRVLIFVSFGANQVTHRYVQAC